ALTPSNAPRRIVVLGGPGSGKTTLFEYMALQIAQRKDGYPRLLPIFYRIRHFDEDRRNAPGKDFWECLHAHCAARLNLALPMGFFRKEISGDGVLLLLDGLDEVPSEARRGELVDCVDHLVQPLSAKSRVLVSSRPHDYTRIGFSTSTYRHFDLCE